MNSQTDTQTPPYTIGNFWRRHPIAVAVVGALVVLAMLEREGPVLTPSGPDAEKFHEKVYTVVNVVDGDTVDIDASDGDMPRTRVRLRGVDAPELAGGPNGAMHFAKESADYARRLLLSRQVRILLTGGESRDRYGRLLAYFTLNSTGEDFNGLMIKTGHAYADPRYQHPRLSPYREFEETARSAGTGLWKEITTAEMPGGADEELRPVASLAGYLAAEPRRCAPDRSRAA